jgi:GWxTD domain-containing protein
MNLRKIAIVATLAIASTLFAAEKKETPLEWGSSPQAYFLTAEEKAEWAMVHSEAGANEFIAKYWAKHGPEFQAEVTSRIAAADKYFAFGGKKGSETQRGRVFMILGAPNRQRKLHNDVPSQNSAFGANSLEQNALTRETWTYLPDRLPKEIQIAQLEVTFQVDVQRGFDVIDNVGVAEPYLLRTATNFVTHYKAPGTAAVPATPTEVKAAVGAAPLVPADDAVWAAGNALNGAVVTGESYISPTEKPFYAIDFYLPKSFAPAGDVIVAGVIRDGAGKQVASVRTPAKAVQYDANGDHFVDAGFELPAGHYTGAFALASVDGKLLASTRNEFDVMPAGHKGVSKILMTSRIDTFEKQLPFDPFTFVATKYAVKGDRRFRAADKIGYFTVIANPTAAPEPSITMRMRVSRDAQVVDAGSWMPVDLSQTGPHTYLVGTQFEPGSLKPGHYTIEVTLRDMKADKTSEAYTKGYQGKAEFDVVQ